MRRSAALLKRESGVGWYQLYKRQPQAFDRFVALPPFAWDAPAAVVRPRVFFEIKCQKEVLGRLEFELANDVVPRTVDNFLQLVTGENSYERSYRDEGSSGIHRIYRGLFLMAGDVENGDGSGSHSADRHKRFFEDENFIIPHTQRGLLSMASVGVNTNGSQFYISLGATPHLNGRCMVFGRLINGEDVLSRVEKMFHIRGVPVNKISFSDCGILR